MSDTPHKPDRGMRADAARNRSLVLDAASRLYAEHGFDVPMADIAAAAGVGRTTVLRNFPSRMDLAAALFERNMQSFRTLAENHKGDPGDFVELFDLKLEMYVRNGGLAEAVQKECQDCNNLQTDRREAAEILLKAAQSAIRAGLMRADVNLETFIVMQQAMSGAMLSGGTQDERRRRAQTLRGLLLTGLGLQNPSPGGPALA